MKKKVLIIGGGIAGMTAGIYALKNGFDATIIEQHSVCGGASTSWRRKGYLFEGGMHWLTGSLQNTSMNKMWRELGALTDEVAIYNRDPFISFEIDGHAVKLYRDLDQLKNHLIEVTPVDEKEILTMCRDVESFKKMQMELTDIKGVKLNRKAVKETSTVLKAIPLLPKMFHYGKYQVKDYAKRYKSPLIRGLLENLVGDEINAIAMMFTLATITSGDGGYPKGGSFDMAQRMAARFTSLGGKILYRTPADQIIIKEQKVIGVKIGDNEQSADAIILATDPLTAIDHLFEFSLTDQWISKIREQSEPLLCTFISVGIEADLSDLPQNNYFKLDKPMHLGDQKFSTISLNNYATYQGYAPDGCTALTTILAGDSYDFWKEMQAEGNYNQEKKRLAASFIHRLEEKYPQLSGKIAVTDVAPPLTYERYLSSYKGSWMTQMTKASMGVYPAKSQHFENLYFASQRLMPPGGVPGAAVMGRRAIQQLCKDNDLVFQGV